MQAIAQELMKIGNVSSTLDKQYILKQHINDAVFKKVLHFIYNPYFKTGISNAKLDKAPYYSGYPVPSSVLEIMEYLIAHPTGDIETCGIVNTWMQLLETPEERWLARAVITQDLQIGVNVTTLNKVFGATFISTLGCMLGTPIDKVPESKQAWPYVVTEKLDGIRRIMLKQNGKVKFFSRSGHEDTGLVDLVEEAKYLPDNYAYDGELLALGTYRDSIALRQATNSIANSKGIKSGLTFNVFDMVPISEFLNGRSSKGTFLRKALLAATFNDPTGAKLYKDPDEYFLQAAALSDSYEHQLILPVPILTVAHSMEDIEPIVTALWQQGKEGVMLNADRAPYESKRVKTLVKMKKTTTYVLRVEGFVEGTGKYEDMLGSLITIYKDCMLQVGSGFSDSERFEIWNNQDKYKGMLFEVESFGESSNKQGFVSLNCPIFKRFIVESNSLFVE